MADSDGPLRLRHRRDISPPLARALLALRSGGDERARLGRVALELGPLLDLPPEAASGIMHRRSLAPRGKLLLKETTLAWVAGSMALLVPLLWVERAGPAITTPAVRSGPPPYAASAFPAASQASQPAPLVAPRVLSDVVQPKLTQPTAAPRGKPSTGLAKRTVSARAVREPSEKDVAPLSAAPQTLELQANPSQQEPDARASRAERTAAVGHLAPSAPTMVVSAPAPTLRSEPELLLAARAVLGSDPARALRLLGEHEARFARGELVPEREVLAIEALRHLGRGAAAAARLSRFRATYPGSLYLERLQR